MLWILWIVILSDPSPLTAVPQPPTPTAPATSPRPTEPLTLAERIVRAERLLEAERKHLNEIKQELADPASEWNRTEAQFKKLDGELEQTRLRKKRLEESEDPNRSERRAEAIKRLEEELVKQEKEWQAARDRFNSGLQLKQTLQKKADALADKISRDEEALERLKAPPGGTAPAASATAPAPAPTPQTPTQPASTPSSPAVVNPLAPGVPVPPPAPSPASQPAQSNAQLDEAKREAEQREAALASARDKTRSIGERIEVLRKNIEIEAKLLAASRERSDTERKRKLELEEEGRQKQREGAPQADMQRIWQQLSEAERAFTRARDATRASSLRLEQMQEELTTLQAEQIAALREEAQTSREAAAAQQRVAQLKNPYTLHNLMQWGIDRGPLLVLILAATWLARAIVRWSGEHLTKIMARHAMRGTLSDRENRARTLVSVFSNAATLFIIGAGGIMVLDTLGVPIIPLMGGAAIFGLAIAFGAQNLIKDYFAGFMVLLEDQYSVNDVVRIGDIGGLVESITLRVTVLRDLKGALHFIPHSTINTVSNFTHGWARAYFEIGVAYKENVDKVMEILVSLAKELRRDPFYGPLILDEVEMLGVDGFADSAVIIKFFLKTQPLQQWKVQREMLRRIKNRFDQVGIEIPFPHRTVYHRYEEQDLEKLAAGRQAA